MAARGGSAPVVQFLLNLGSSSFVQLLDAHAAFSDGPGRTALHEAASRGHVEAARALLEAGCHTSSPCGFERETPLAFAINGQHVVVRIEAAVGSRGLRGAHLTEDPSVAAHAAAQDAVQPARPSRGAHTAAHAPAAAPVR
mmetsp:Transcript_23050/g.73788  ORF Transcript_23050/g.73788 Transcript_23050/m.73788 type:complete len:141 (-) Transcript_23050:173-595(-)